jgi:hypothetical protein
MKKSVAIAGGFVLFLMSSLANAAPHDFCAHTDIIMPPPGCVSGDELAAYERGYRNGIFIVNYAYDSYGQCADWFSGDIPNLIADLKAYFGALTSIDPVDLCRLGGITDALSDREAEFGSISCCGITPTCADRGDTEGPQYADTYCMMVMAVGACFDPGPYTRGPIVDQCEDDFERHCDFYFTDTARYGVPGCNEYTNNSPPPACLTPFINYRDFICEAL